MLSNSSPFAWWKILAFVLLMYGAIMGFMGNVPRMEQLGETIRNLYFHVPMWFAMTLFLLIAFAYSIVYLKTGNLKHDRIVVEFTRTGMFFGILGLLTGMMWAKFTWGAFWTKDPKLNAAAIAMLIYTAYMILRDAIADEDKKARITAVYNIFAFPAFMALIYIMPRLTDSLHPGNGGNPGFNAYDRDREMNMIFYSSILGFMLLGTWITTLRVRLRLWADKKDGLITNSIEHAS
ncbi:cytochrome c biogenesis protein CcsA [Cytophaga aurantiaca]|uniref:cytochrome c biogenesis protein CcsA n=1 Tax=Cytophaga aurantiaca TaxID=29530 RepID=UPI0003650033|nr:cytochrome c biogenesis protein CcsA [Cytophaga aurantiaca]